MIADQEVDECSKEHDKPTSVSGIVAESTSSKLLKEFLCYSLLIALIVVSRSILCKIESMETETFAFILTAHRQYFSFFFQSLRD